jgi:hypothetical protein
MAYSYIYTEVTGTDSTETISASSVTFPYIRKSHVEVYISGAGDSLATFKTNLSTDSITALVQGTDYNIADSGDITFVTSTLTLSNVHQIQVKRNSDLSTNYVNFLDGSVVTEGNLDDAQKQQLYLSQELADAKATLLEDGSLESGAMSFSGLADTTIATPTSGQVPVYDGSDSWDNKTHSVALTGDVTGTANMDNTGAVSIAATIQDGAVQFDDLDAAAVVVASEGITATDVAVPTSQAVKEYVDTQLTAEDLDVTSDSGTIAIDLDSATLTVAGGTGIDTSATGTTVTAAIDSTVATLDDTQTLTNKTLTTPTLTSPAINTGVSGSAIDTDLSAVSSSDDTLASAKAIKTYVDAQIDTEDTFAELNDTDIVTPTEGQIPVHDGTDSWDNKTHSVALTGDVTGTANMAATGAVSVATTLVGGLKNVVEDTTPQLGGALDTAGNSIVNDTTDGDVTIAPDGTGQVVLANTEILLDEVSAPGTPGANKGLIYAKDDSGTTGLYFKDPAGVETDLLEGGGSAGVTGVTLIADDANTASDSSGNVDITIAGGSGIATTANSGATLTVTHDDTSTQASVNNSGQTFIQDITLDTFGHITAIESAVASGGGGFVDTSGTPVENDFAKFIDVDTIEGRSYSETAADLKYEMMLALASDFAGTTGAGWNSDITNATGLYGLTLDAGDAPDSTYGLKLKDGTNSGYIDFFEGSGAGTNKITLVGQAAIGIDYTVTLPSNTGTILTTASAIPATWSGGGVLGVSNGGTSIASYTEGDMLYATDATTLAKLAKGSASQVLAMNSGATAPEWVAAPTDTVDMGSGFTVSATTDTTATTITENDDLFFAAGTGITCETTADGTVTTTLDLGGLTDDTGLGNTSGWSSGDFLAMVESGGTEKKIKPPAEIGIACSDETTVLDSSAEGVKATILIPRDMRVTEVKASLTTAANTGLTVDVKYHNTTPSSASSIFDASQEIEMGGSGDLFKEKSGSVFASSLAYFDMTENGFVTVEIPTSGGDSDAAAGLKIWLLGYWS